MEDGQNYYQWFQYLLTNVNDHTVRIGRLEQLLENVLTQISTQHASSPPTLVELGPSDKNVFTHSNRAQTDSAQSDRRISTHASDKQTADSRQTPFTQEELVIVANFQRENAGASYRETSDFCNKNGVPMGKDKVGKIIEYLRGQGSI